MSLRDTKIDEDEQSKPVPGCKCGWCARQAESETPKALATVGRIASGLLVGLGSVQDTPANQALIEDALLRAQEAEKERIARALTNRGFVWYATVVRSLSNEEGRS